MNEFGSIASNLVNEDVVNVAVSKITNRAGHTSRMAYAGMTPDVPYDFIELSECLPGQTDRHLGYFGKSRYVSFRYEPRAEDVIWRDERSFGIATGAWQAFLDEIQPLADLYGVNVGASGRQADHVLVFDRNRVTAYFAPRQSAEEFLSQRQQVLPEAV